MSESFDNLTPKQLAKILAIASKDAAEANQQAGNSLKEYNEILLKIKENTKFIAQTKKDIAEADAAAAKAQDVINELNKESKSSGKALSKDKKKELARQKEILRFNKAAKKEMVEQVAQVTLLNDGLKNATRNSNLLVASYNTGSKAIGKMAKDMWKLNGSWGEAMGWQKGIQKTEQSMGILSSQSLSFRSNLSKAALSTNQLGINAGDLAKIQGGYSEQIGRSIQLSQQGLEAMGELASGAMLGADGAAEMAANMDSFGISAVGARDRVEEMLNLASSMGINSVKVTKNLTKNMQLANKFHFKGGVKGMARLATEAAKLGINMDAVATLADKVFRPEGAVEVASKLQTMGGEFAKLGDPMVLMHKARNDFEAFTMDIGRATKEFVKFNSETGEFDVSGHALDRVKEIANITGMSSEELIKMGRTAKRLETIEMGTMLDDENTAFVSSVAKFNESTKEWQVTVGNSERNIKSLNNAEVKRLRNEKASLAERAKQAQSFDETWDNLKNTFKTLLLPLLNGLSEGLKKPMQAFMDWSKSSGGLNVLFDTAKSLGESIHGVFTFLTPMLEGLLNFIKENPLTSMVTAIAGIGLFKTAQWFANGLALGAGFNSVASVGGAGDLVGNGSRGIGKKLSGKLGLGKSLGKNLKSGGAIGGGALSAVIGGYNEWTDNSENGMGTAENIGRTGTRAAGAGLGAWGGAAAGAAIGSVVPIVGTAIGGIIGGILGGMGGDYIGDVAGDRMFDDVIIRSGQAPIGISKDDDILAAKKGGAVDKALDKSTGGGSGGNNNMNISFTPLTINGSLELVGDDVSSNIDLDDPIFMRDLSRVIQEQIRKAIGGGKLNPNPT